MLQTNFIFFTVIILICPANALMGYDCNGPHPNGTLVSLLEMDECMAPEGRIILHGAHIEIIQISRDANVSVLSCRIESEQAIYDNGNLKRYKPVKIYRSYLPIELHECIHMHNNRKLQIKHVTFDKLKINLINSRLLPIGNNITPMSRIPKTLTNITIKNYLHISFKQIFVKVNTLKNKIVLPSGTCKYTDLHCIDEDGYHNFWSPMYHSGCCTTTHSVIYRGTATRIESHEHLTAYSLRYKLNNLTIFVGARHDACNATLIQTEHPQLLVKETNNVSSELSPLNRLHTIADLVSPYYHIINYSETNIQLIYFELLLTKCVNKRPELQAALQVAHLDPDQFAYTLTGGPGYSAHIRGEAAEIFPCVPVPVQTRVTDSCFLELPILVGGEPKYLTPKTRIISATGTEIACGPETAAVFRLKNIWAQHKPCPEDIAVPSVLNTYTHAWGRSVSTVALNTATADSPTQQDYPNQKTSVFSLQGLIRIIGATISMVIIWQCCKPRTLAARKSEISPAHRIEIIDSNQKSNLMSQHERTCSCTRLSCKYTCPKTRRSMANTQQLHPSLYKNLTATSKTLARLERRLDDCLERGSPPYH